MLATDTCSLIGLGLTSTAMEDQALRQIACISTWRMCWYVATGAHAALLARTGAAAAVRMHAYYTHTNMHVYMDYVLQTLTTGQSRQSSRFELQCHPVPEPRPERHGLLSVAQERSG